MSNLGLLAWLRRRYEMHHGVEGLLQMLGPQPPKVGRDYRDASHAGENARRRRQIERGVILPLVPPQEVSRHKRQNKP